MFRNRRVPHYALAPAALAVAIGLGGCRTDGSVQYAAVPPRSAIASDALGGAVFTPAPEYAEARARAASPAGDLHVNAAGQGE